MELHPSHIRLNGHLVPVDDLLRRNLDGAGWEQDWLRFLVEWYNVVDYIEVQTSGSTGEPKTIRLKKQFVAASALRTIQFFGLNEDDRVLHCLPSRFIAGKLMVIRALIGRLDLYVVDPSTNFDILRQDLSFKFAAMVVNQADKCLEFGFSNLEFLLLGGSSIPSALEQQLAPLRTACFLGYGMTETATHIALRSLNGPQSDQRYHCLPGIRLALDERGCLLIDMPGLDGGYLKTNDLAQLTGNNTFRILGRADHRIISGGMKFSPEVLEQKLEGTINSAFIISSKPHDKLGQQLVLVVEGTENPNLLTQIKAACKERLNRYEQPREIIFIKELPRTENGKLKR